MDKPEPKGGYESMLDLSVRSDPGRLRSAVIEVMDTAEYVTRWMVDHGVEVSPDALARFTDLILQRARELRAEPL